MCVCARLWLCNFVWQGHSRVGVSVCSVHLTLVQVCLCVVWLDINTVFMHVGCLYLVCFVFIKHWMGVQYDIGKMTQ